MNKQTNIYRNYTFYHLTDGRILANMPKVGDMIFENETELKAYIDGYLLTKEHFKLIENELRNAVAKHPKFCDDFSGADVEIVRDNLEFYRKANEGKQHADLVLLEEFYEAVEAYMNGDKKQCLKELAQCGAVIIRMMEFVKKEMEVKAV